MVNMETDCFNMRLPDFEAWAIFAAVAEYRSFTEAAKALSLSKATVSKAVSRLENQVGAALFHRTSRRLSLTETGRALTERASRIWAEGLAADEAARDEATVPQGVVKLAAPMTFGQMHVGPAVADFLADYPGITIDLHLSDEKINIIDKGIDIALRIAALPDSSLRTRQLGRIDASIVAAPSYLDRHGRPVHPAELGVHRCFSYAYVDTPNLLRFRGPGQEEVVVRPEGPFRSNSGDVMLPALRAGLGIAVLPNFIVGDDLAEGRLEAILAEWSPPPVSLHLLTPPGVARSARVSLFADFLSERFRALCRGRS
jgi:DNA-binding transcriptional LysR family regulator